MKSVLIYFNRKQSERTKERERETHFIIIGISIEKRMVV